MAFPDSAWTRGGRLSTKSVSSEQKVVTWNIRSFLRENWEEKWKLGSSQKLKSHSFDFAGATWNLFISFDQDECDSLFGINVRTPSSSDTVAECRCNVSFKEPFGIFIKNIKSEFRCQRPDSHWAVEDFLIDSELSNFLECGTDIVCRINVKILRTKEACSQTEIAYSNGSSSVDAHTQTQFLEIAVAEIPTVDLVYKVCQDFKTLFLSGEGSDLTIQVKDQSFKAHRSILMARSSVFAATFRHDMKENATGVVVVDDCDPSSFPILLEFLYCGSTEKLSVENMFSLYTSADKYDVQSLKLECLEFVKMNLSVDTFCETVRLGVQHSETNLLKLTIDFFARNMKKIVLTAKWQAFILENPIQGNEFFIKALKLDAQDDEPV